MHPGEVCLGGAAALPPLVSQLLSVGVLDVSLRAGAAGIRALAVGWGWSESALPTARLPAVVRQYEAGPD